MTSEMIQRSVTIGDPHDPDSSTSAHVTGFPKPTTPTFQPDCTPSVLIKLTNGQTTFGIHLTPDSARELAFALAEVAEALAEVAELVSKAATK